MHKFLFPAAPLPAPGEFVDVADFLLGAADTANVRVGGAPAQPAFFQDIIPALDLEHREIHVQGGRGAVLKINAPGAFFRHALKTLADITIQKMFPVEIHALDVGVVQSPNYFNKSSSSQDNSADLLRRISSFWFNWFAVILISLVVILLPNMTRFVFFK